MIHILDRIIPKEKELIVVGGPRYYGNSRYFFELIRQHPEYKYSTVWLGRNKQEINEIKKSFGNNSAKSLLSPSGIGTFLRARVCAFSHGASDLLYMLSSNSPKLIVNLWHGIPIKHLDGIMKVKRIRWDLFCVSSQWEAEYFRDECGINSKIVVTGQPRNQYLYEKLISVDITEYKQELIRKIVHVSALDVDENDLKIILYAPTYRGHIRTKVFPFDDFDDSSYDILEQILIKHNARLMIRFHPNELNSMNDPVIQEMNRRKLIIDGNMNIISSTQDLILISDLLITDYSSIYFDFLIKQHPIILIPYDQEEYDSLYGFAFNYDEVSPESQVKSFRHFIELLEKSLENAGYFNEFLKNDMLKFHEIKFQETIPTLLKIIDRETENNFLNVIN
ncbi:MAG: CDP-glycerol glycerophosphotransferase family protein [Candidatus Heimdallarchaeota archaeon]|nr:CDP-glycerol glycerophosphotransferase family protein [Candidatus Heimdallarchaeota archaeon]